MAKLKAVIDQLDDVEEVLREAYAATTIKDKDGKDKDVFVLQIENVDAHPDVFSLRESRRKDRELITNLTKERDELKGKIEALPEGFDHEEWDRLKAEEEARKDNPDAKDVQKQIDAGVNARMQAVEAKHEKALKKVMTELNTERDARIEITKQLKERIVEGEIAKALDEAGIVKPSFRRAAKAILMQDIIVDDEDGRMVARMKPDLGGDDVAKYVNGIWVQNEDLGKTFVEPPKGSGGNGSQAKGGLQKNPWDPKTKDFDEQTRIFRTDPEKARRLAKEHGVVL